MIIETDIFRILQETLELEFGIMINDSDSYSTKSKVTLGVCPRRDFTRTQRRESLNHNRTGEDFWLTCSAVW